MTLLSFLILLLIAGICGAISRAIVSFRGGILVSIAIGFIGALIGMWLSGALGLREMFAVNVGVTGRGDVSAEQRYVLLIVTGGKTLQVD